MAWQLIYTSSSRLLDAGASGFGTVARHNAIPPIIVKSVERISQFARQAGYAASRVILSHRVITVGSSRFHILSQIRDAGADYSGRTNHIAHHLIATAAEVSQLGGSGVSPADVLVQMNWRSHWTGAPAWLDAKDEVQLSQFSGSSDPSAPHWMQVTGRANCQWLLALGKFSKGSCLIVPHGTPLIQLFAETLMLPSQQAGAWQIGFTTSLQPTDELVDFRWVGVEQDSPKKADLESSGRPILNLTKPESLPEPEVPVTYLPTPTFARNPRQLSEVPPPSLPSPTSLGGFTPSPPTISQVGRKQVVLKKAPSRPSKLPVLVLVAGIVLLIVAGGVYWTSKQDAEELLSWRNDIRIPLDTSVINKLTDLRKSNKEAAEGLLNVAKEQFATLESTSDLPRKQTLADWRSRFQGENAPPEIQNLEDQLTKWVEISKGFSQSKPNIKELKSAIDGLVTLSPGEVRDEFKIKFDKLLEIAFKKEFLKPAEIKAQSEDLIALQDAALKVAKKHEHVKGLFVQLVAAQSKTTEVIAKKDDQSTKAAQPVTNPPIVVPEKSPETLGAMPAEEKSKQSHPELAPAVSTKIVFLANLDQLKNLKIPEHEKIKVIQDGKSEFKLFGKNFREDATKPARFEFINALLTLVKVAPDLPFSSGKIRLLGESNDLYYEIYIAGDKGIEFDSNIKSGLTLAESPPRLVFSEGVKTELNRLRSCQLGSAKFLMRAKRFEIPFPNSEEISDDLSVLIPYLSVAEIEKKKKEKDSLALQVAASETALKTLHEEMENLQPSKQGVTAISSDEVLKKRKEISAKEAEIGRLNATITQLETEIKNAKTPLREQFTGTFDLYLRVEPDLEVLIHKFTLAKP